MNDAILKKINEGLWEEALQLFLESMKNDNLSEESFIIGATILEHFNDMDGMYKLLENGLTRYPQSYELYLMLGNYYSNFNHDLAFLCYENALFYSETLTGENSEDSTYIRSTFQAFKSQYVTDVRNVSFVILTHNQLPYTKQCIDSIRETCFNGCYEIIVVDNASTDESQMWLKSQTDIHLITNDENLGFPTGCNQGIKAASDDNDIFLLNNDTIMTRNALFLLRMGLYSDDSNGATGAMTNYASNSQNIHSDKELSFCMEYAKKNNVIKHDSYELKTKLIMFATLIKRSVLNKVGLLDERFAPGNLEDDDYGVRILKAGFRNILCHNCFIYHYGSISFESEGKEKYPELIEENRKKFKEKWGFSANYFSNARKELINLINRDNNDCFSVLEIGCGMGDTLAHIKYIYPNSSVHGLEIDNKVVNIAKNKFDIVEGNIETTTLDSSLKYDYIIFGDVLEHLHNPEQTLINVRNSLTDNGLVISSIPNLMNAKVIYDLLHGSFTYEDSGILDKTHLRFFTKKEITKLFDNSGYEIIKLKNSISLPNSTKEYETFFEKLLAIEGVAERKLFDAYQYLIVAKKKNNPHHNT